VWPSSYVCIEQQGRNVRSIFKGGSGDAEAASGPRRLIEISQIDTAGFLMPDRLKSASGSTASASAHRAGKVVPNRDRSG